MKAVDTLIRLAKSEVDAAQRALSDLLKIEETIDQALIDLADEVQNEAAFAANNPDINRNFAAYSRRMADKKALLQEQRDGLQPMIAQAREKLAECFEEQKKYEITLERQREEEQREADKREQQELDEIALRANQPTRR